MQAHRCTHMHGNNTVRTEPLSVTCRALQRCTAVRQTHTHKVVGIPAASFSGCSYNHAAGVEKMKRYRAAKSGDRKLERWEQEAVIRRGSADLKVEKA